MIAHQKSGWLAATIIATALFAVPAHAAPVAVERAQESTVLVKRPDLNAVAFAVDRRGGFLTTEQAASRGTDIKVVFPGGRTLPAQRTESDAPAGLAMLRVPGAPSLRPLAFSSSGAAPGDQVWLVAPPRRIPTPDNVRLDVPGPELRQTEGVLFLPERVRSGATGSPLLNGSGRVVGVLRSDRNKDDGFLEAVAVDKRPSALPAIAPPGKKDFPAVPVVIGLGILLLLANIWFTMRRRRDVAAVVTTTRAPSEAASTASTVDAEVDTVPEDDLGITLRNRTGGSAPKSKAPTASSDRIVPEPPTSAAAGSPGDEDPGDADLVTLKRR